MPSKVVIAKYRKKLTLWIAQQGRCWLCGEPMPRPIMGGPAGNPCPDYPTFDHVIPASQGGNRSYQNIMLAHQRCNQKRGARREVVAVRHGANG